MHLCIKNYDFKYHDRYRVNIYENSSKQFQTNTILPRKRQVEKDLGNQSKKNRHIPRNVQGEKNNSRIKKLELKNQTLKAKLVDLKRTLEKFVNGRSNLVVIFARQRSKRNKWDLGYRSSTSKVKHHQMHRLHMIMVWKRLLG